MNEPSPSPPPPRAISHRAVAVAIAAALLFAGALWAAWPAFRRIGGLGSRTAGSSRHARDVYADTPYRNARPGVKYVGDAACARCHREIAEAYRSHPMGRSLAPVGDASSGPAIDAAAGNPFTAQTLSYTAERRGGKEFHKETLRDSTGKVLAETEAEVRFALGSGTRGISYLVDRDGFLFQSPMSWYAQKGRWDLAPGYEKSNQHFHRAIEPDCLFCHANLVDHVPGTENRYAEPIFRGHAIGCERCHGPGELHAGLEDRSASPDLTIVNPADLTPALRESVCQQCHLQGSLRFPRAGREAFDFRPGLPFQRFWAVIFKKTGERGEFEAVGQVEQMESSRCYRASQGQLGCISCHDPHRLPAPAEKVAYYRNRCLECHQDKGCALPVAERQARGKGDSCIACHMPRPTVTNIPHTAGTDHRIPRGTPGSEPKGIRDAPTDPGALPLVDYHAGQMTDAERRDAERDLGVALSLAGWLMRSSPQQSRGAGELALPKLEEAIHERPDDLFARESLGLALGLVGRNEDALRTFEGVLAVAPGREASLRSIAFLLPDVQRLDLAREAWRKTIAINPWRPDYHSSLANVCMRLNDWPGAIAACRDALRLDPASIDVRMLLIQCYLRSGEPAKAEAEFQVLLALSPAGRGIWQSWFAEQKAGGTSGAGP